MRLSAEEMWGPTLTLWGRSVRKFPIQQQVGFDIPRSDTFITSLFGRMVLNSLLKSTDSRSRWDRAEWRASSVGVNPGWEISGDVGPHEYVRPDGNSFGCRWSSFSRLRQLWRISGRVGWLPKTGRG